MRDKGLVGEMRWPGEKRIALVFNVMLEQWSDGKAPGIGRVGNPLGRPGVLDTEALSWARYGPKRGIWRLLEIFERQAISATVYASAILAERHPDPVREAAARGHEIAGHGYAQDLLPVYLAESEEAESIRTCTRVLEQASGQRPRGWISPRVTPSLNTPRLLAEAGYLWHGDCADDDLPYVQTFGPARIVAVPFSMEVNDLPHYIRWGNAPRAMVTIFEDTLAQFDRERGACLLDVTVHAHLFGRPFGAWAFERIAEIVKARADIWVGPRGDLARHVLATSAPPLSEARTPP